jgi:phospholipid/cholesterol/gamma-HCH transport system substrate-binding protein
VGAFVLVLGAALIGAVLWLASGGAFQQKYVLYQAIMDESVAGLSLNAPVKYIGVDVGKVRAIEIDPGNPERVNLLFAIDPGTPVKEDTTAVLKTQGLTGIAFVELSGGTRDAPMLVARDGAPYPVIRTKPSLAARLENVLTRVLAKLDKTSANIDSLLSDENQAAVKSALADIAEVARTLAARKDTIDKGIVSAARTFDNASRATAQAGPMMERVGRAAEAVDKMGNELALAGTNAGKAVDKMGNELALAGASATKAADAVGADVKRFTAETLPEIERLMGEIGALASSLRRVSEQTERDPRGLLFGRKPVPPGPGETGAAP